MLRTEGLDTLSAMSLRCGRLPRLHQLRYEAVRFGWLDMGVRPSPTADLVKVYSPRGRHVILPLESTSLRTKALPALAQVALQVGLPSSAALVELSMAITLPSASSQEPHTDISPATRDHTVTDERGQSSSCAPLVTCWLALQPVTAAMGPTVVFPRTHTRFAQRQRDIEQLDAIEALRVHEGGCDHDGDGSLAALSAQGNEYAKQEVRRNEEEAEAEASAREHAAFGEALPPVSLLLGVGDAGLMDTRLVHYGSGRCGSSVHGPHGRVLLNATFAAAGAHSRIHGFTYHRRADALPQSIASILLDAE